MQKKKEFILGIRQNKKPFLNTRWNSASGLKENNFSISVYMYSLRSLADSFCEIWLIARHKFFNTELKVYNNKVGFSFDVVKAIGEEDSGILLNVANRLKELDLSEEEASLMVACVIFFSGITSSTFLALF